MNWFSSIITLIRFMQPNLINWHWHDRGCIDKLLFVAFSGNFSFGWQDVELWHTQAVAAQQQHILTSVHQRTLFGFFVVVVVLPLLTTWPINVSITKTSPLHHPALCSCTAERRWIKRWNDNVLYHRDKSPNNSRGGGSSSPRSSLATHN